MARIDIEIEDYLDEVDSKYLIQELQKRKDVKIPFDLSYFELPQFKNSEQVLSFIKKVLHLREWHDKERIINEIKEL